MHGKKGLKRVNMIIRVSHKGIVWYIIFLLLMLPLHKLQIKSIESFEQRYTINTELYSTSSNFKRPQIIKVKTIPSARGGWVVLPNKPGQLIIKVKTINAKRLKFWIVPTGSETWKYRKLLGELSNGKNVWSFTWNYGNELIHDHIVIQAIGDQGLEESTIINVTNH